MTSDSGSWSPEQYERFAAERRLPYEELVRLIEPSEAMAVVDLGCGTGELTVALAATLGAASVRGLDASPAMLARAKPRASDVCSFEHADVRDFAGSEYDLVFSNAALHWLPDHPRLFARLRNALRPGGQLAVHMPANFGQPTHTLARELAAQEPFCTALHGRTSGGAVQSPEVYAQLLRTLGFQRQVVRQVVYMHELPSADAALQWLRGSLLTWYRSSLCEALFTQFQAQYADRLRRALPQGGPFGFTYRRLLLWARLPR